MDKKRAAIRQTKAIEAQGLRLAAIEVAISQPVVVAESFDLAPAEKPATAAQIAALAEQVTALAEQVTALFTKIDAIEQALTAPAPAAQPTKK